MKLSQFQKDQADIAEKTLASGISKKFSIKLSDLDPNASFELEILDQEYGFALKDWQKMGSPEPPMREQTRILKTKALNTKKEQIKANSNGQLNWERVINPWTIILLKGV